MANLFESNWSATKGALMEGLSGQRQKTMDVVLENAKRQLSEAATAGATGAGSVATLNKVMLPLIRRVMPSVIANELVGVQPMSGPVGQIHTLRVRYAETGGGATAGDEALSPFKLASTYAGSPDATAAAEGTPGKKMSIQILKETVEAKTRRLSARWTFEAAQDAEAMHGVDVEAEIMQALAQEIVVEIDQEIIGSLRNLAGAGQALDFNGLNAAYTPTYVGDRHALLAIEINRAANRIAARTRRGAGNYIVVSPEALTVLQSASTSTFARTTEGSFESPTNTKFVGTLNGTIKVFVDNYAADGTKVLVGYKGSSETDAPAFYCPYVPLMSTGPVMDPTTFEPVVSFMTRYGYKELTNTASSLGNAADYVDAISMANVAFQ
tara:strand:- start:9083 stop:10228 length:1146 start_codon:yes stop_codon:yes gene_type:complete